MSDKTFNDVPLRWKRLRMVAPEFVIEFLARVMGYFGGIIIPARSIQIEARVRARLTGLKFGFNGFAIGRGFILDNASSIQIGKRVTLRNNVKIIAGTRGWCIIGDNTHISHDGVLSAIGGIEIGEGCAISSGVIIYTSTYDHRGGLPLNERPARIAPVRIESHVHIGAGTLILPGVRIGKNSIIGAGSVVTKDVASNEIVVGVPAGPIRQRMKLQ